MRLAVLFGEPSVKTLQAKITAREFHEWVAYNNIVGLPDPWLIGARLAHCINGVEMKDFIPRKKPPMTDNQIWSMFKRQAKHGKNS